MLITSSKSQLAIEYAYRAAKKNNDMWIFWFHAATSTSLEQDFRRLADKVKLSGRRNPKANIPLLVHDWLSDQQNGKWLIILDSADDGDVLFTKSQYAQEIQPLASYFPQTQNGSILVTARDKDVARKLTGEERNLIQVGPLEKKEALKLLEKKLGPVSDQTQALELVETLDCIALAIIQAAAYIHAKFPRTSINKYLKTLRTSEKKAINLLEHEGGYLRRNTGDSNAVLKTWHMSFQHIRQKRESAGNLLALMSFFDRQDIPEWVLKNPDNQDAKPDQHTGEDSDAASITSSENDRVNSFEKDIDMLSNFCLISVGGELNDAFDMHRLVQLSTRQWLKLNGLQGHFYKLFVLRMAHVFPEVDFEHWLVCQRLLPHVESCVDYSVAKQDTNTFCTWSKLVNNASNYYVCSYEYGKAERLLRMVFDGYEARFGANNINTLLLNLKLSCIICDPARLEEPEEMQLAIFDSFAARLGADHPTTLHAMLTRAQTFAKKRHWKRVEEIGSRAVATCNGRLGGYSGVLRWGMRLVAEAYFSQGEWKEAETAWVGVQEMCSKAFGSYHQQTLWARNFVSKTYMMQHQWGKAEATVPGNFQSCKEKLGETHPTTLDAMGLLADLRSHQKRFDETEELEESLFKQHELVIDTGYQRLGFLEQSLFLMFDMPERQDGVVNKCSQLLDIYKLMQTPYSDRSTTMRLLINIYVNQNQLEEAEKIALEALEGLRKELEPQHEYVQDMVLLIGRINLLLRRYKASKNYYQLAIANDDLRTGESTLTALWGLSAIHMDRERWEDATNATVQALNFSIDRFGPTHELTVKARELLVNVTVKEVALKMISTMISTIDQPDTTERTEGLLRRSQRIEVIKRGKKRKNSG